MAPRAAKSGGMKTGVTPLKHPPQNALCCPATCAARLLLDADSGVMVWGGTHTIRRNSGEQQTTERLPRRWLPRTASERSGHPEFTPNARLRRAENAPKARPLRGGYGRRCAVCRSGFDAPTGRLIMLAICSFKSDCRDPPQGS